MINEENETYPADVGNPEPREHRQPRSEPPGYSRDPTCHRAAGCHCRRPASRALIAMRLTPPSLHVTVNYQNKTTAFLVEDTATRDAHHQRSPVRGEISQAAAANRKQTPTGPPEASRRHGSSSPTSPNEPELRRGLLFVTYPDRRLCFSARSPPLTPLTGWLASPLASFPANTHSLELRRVLWLVT
ncbi:unnamed protein product [Pleuronectes platessa]|uniref:Uncharacterized protein n=1 Tax=Pleuronectes platessa TaxID=8262 RepID=A0A9N7YV40_PLEPL|nr:unnamed protein product [Pleuronectes platessa]